MVVALSTSNITRPPSLLLSVKFLHKSKNLKGWEKGEHVFLSEIPVYALTLLSWSSFRRLRFSCRHLSFKGRGLYPCENDIIVIVLSVTHGLPKSLDFSSFQTLPITFQPLIAILVVATKWVNGGK